MLPALVFDPGCRKAAFLLVNRLLALSFWLFSEIPSEARDPDIHPDIEMLQIPSEAGIFRDMADLKFLVTDSDPSLRSGFQNKITCASPYQH